MATKRVSSTSRAPSVRDRVTGALRDDILSGEFVPGQRLSEAELCAHLDASRTSVREALRQLEAERLIEIQPHRGPSVARLEWEDAAQIYDVRELIEPEVVRLFAANATPEQLAAMTDALKLFEDAISDGVDQHMLIQSTTAFYDLIFEGCSNTILVEILRGLRARINLLRSRSMSHAERPRQSLDEMGRILKAIAAGDIVEAQQAARDHIRNARSYAQSAMSTKSTRKAGPRAAKG